MFRSRLNNSTRPRCTVYVLSTIPTWYLVDTLGRRVILLSGATVSSLSLSLSLALTRSFLSSLVGCSFTDMNESEWGFTLYFLQAMAIALTLVGFFLYLDQSYTPVAVVTSVIVYNAAFGYSWG